MANNASYASAAKPNIAGAIYRAAKTATLPTTADGALSSDYKCLGYISEDGITNSNSRSSDTFKAIQLQTSRSSEQGCAWHGLW